MKVPPTPYRTRALIPSADGAGRWCAIEVLRHRSIQLFAPGCTSIASVVDALVDGEKKPRVIALVRLEGHREPELNPDHPTGESSQSIERRPSLRSALTGETTDD